MVKFEVNRHFTLYSQHGSFELKNKTHTHTLFIGNRKDIQIRRGIDIILLKILLYYWNSILDEKGMSNSNASTVDIDK